MSLDAMKQALAALEQYTNVVTSVNDPNSWVSVSDGGKPARDAITALRAAIEQAQGKHEDWCASLTQLLLSMPPKPAPCNCKPRTAPPRQWQGLTDEEIVAVYGDDLKYQDGDYRRYARAIEAKLREKNT